MMYFFFGSVSIICFIAGILLSAYMLRFVAYDITESRDLLDEQEKRVKQLNQALNDKIHSYSETAEAMVGAGNVILNNIRLIKECASEEANAALHLDETIELLQKFVEMCRNEYKRFN